MIGLLALAVLNALICAGLFMAMRFEFRFVEASKRKKTNIDIDPKTKGILWWFKFYILDKMPYRLSKPFGNCLVCMASVYSFLPYWYVCDWNFTNFDTLVTYPFYIFAVAGINAIIDNFINN